MEHKHNCTIDEHKLKPGIVFRSSALGNNVDLLPVVLTEKNIVSVMDLRRPGEYDPENLAEYKSIVKELEIEWINLPFGDHGDIGVETRDYDFALPDDNLFYEWLPRYGTFMLKDVVRMINHHQLPLVIHCSAGRDRTGMVVAMLQDM